MSRHLTGLGIGVIMFIVMFFVGAWGFLRLDRLPVAAGASSSALPAHGGSLLLSGSVISAGIALIVTAAFAGFLIAWPTLSPLAAGLPGVIAIGWTGLYLLNVKAAVDLIPLRGHAFGAGWEALLFTGILGIAGLALIVPMCLPARWSDPCAEDDEEMEADVNNAREYVADLRATMNSDSAGYSRRNGPGVIGAQPGGRPAPPGGRRMVGGQHRQGGGQPRYSRGQRPYTVDEPRYAGRRPPYAADEPRYAGGQRPYAADEPRYAGGRPPYAADEQRVTGGQRMLTGPELREQLRRSGSQQRLPDER